MAEAVRNQPSMFARLSDSAQEKFTGLGKKASQFASDYANKDTLTSVATNIDPFRGGISKKWCEKPTWAKVTVGAATASLGTSIYLICKNKWLEKPLWLRRTTGALLVLPAIYFGGYGVYTLFRKGTEWNNNRLADKAQKKIQSDYDKKFEEIFKKSAEEQYTAIAKLAEDNQLGLEWGTDSVELKFLVRGDIWSFKKPITDKLHKVQLQKDEETKQAEIKKQIVDGFTAINNELLDISKTKPQVRDLFNSVFFRDMKPNGFVKGDCKFPKENGKYYLVVNKDGKEIHKQEVCRNTRNHLVEWKKGVIYGATPTQDLSQSVMVNDLDDN